VLALQFVMHVGPIRLGDPPMAALLRRKACNALSFMFSGRGWDMSVLSARFEVSCTPQRARPSRRAFSCVNTDEDFSRITSRASRIPIRSSRHLGLPKGYLIRPTAALANP
jgi:hypothetical protein